MGRSVLRPYEIGSRARMNRGKKRRPSGASPTPYKT